MTASLGELADRTPATRDRYVDFLRAVSILCVVIGHWTIGMLHWDHGSIRSTSAIGLTSWLWLATWFLQVMPIFFFVGGFSNLVAFDAYQERGESTGAFIRSRLKRLLRPSLVFLGVWTVVQVTLHLADIGATAGPPLWGDTRLLRGMLPPGATIRSDRSGSCSSTPWSSDLTVDDRAASAVRAMGPGRDGLRHDVG